MSRMRNWLLIGSLAVALPSMTACNPAGVVNDLIDNTVNTIGESVGDFNPISDTSDLYSAIAGFLDTAVSDWGNYDTANSEQSYFGDSAASYTQVPPSDVQTTLDEVLAEVSSADTASSKARASASERAVTVAANGYLTATLFPAETLSNGENEGGGVFRGAWYDSDGNQIGAIRGEYRPFNDDAYGNFWGSGGFRGKLIDMDGRFQGFIRGRYAKTPDGKGIFLGRWFDRDDRYIGLMKGDWNQGGGSSESALDAPDDSNDNVSTDVNDDVVSSSDGETTSSDPAEDDPTADQPGTFAGRWVAFSVCDESDALPEADDNNDASNLVPGTNETLTENGLAALNEAAEMSEEQIGEESVNPAGVGDDNCIDPNLSHGAMRGWHVPGNVINLPSGNFSETGRFRGQWRNADGETIGYFMGSYVVFSNVVLPSGVGANEFPQGDEPQADDDNSGDDDSMNDNSGSGDEGESEPGSAGDNDDESAPPPGGNLPGRIPGSKGRLFGKVVDAEGNFVGYIHGVFGRGPNGLGVLRGQFFNGDSGEFEGVFRGRWDNAPDATGGPLWAVWSGTEAFGADGPAAVMQP